MRITFSVDLVVQELAFVVACVEELEYSFAGFCAVSVLAFVTLSIEPLLNPKSILFIFLPLPDILCAI